MINNFSGKYEFLSNFYSSPIMYRGILYPTVEHAFQAAKTVSQIEKIVISKLATPGQAKRAGRNVSLRPDWEQIKAQVMLDLLTLKFADPVLKQKLIDTGEEELIKGNYWGDTYWGICRRAGKNILGKLLIQVRENLKSN